MLGKTKIKQLKMKTKELCRDYQSRFAAQHYLQSTIVLPTNHETNMNLQTFNFGHMSGGKSNINEINNKT